MSFDFNDLFILDLANNHNGSVDHAKKIIDSMRDAVPVDVRCAIKIQLRDLPDFIHKDYRDSKLGKRFLGTALTKGEFDEIAVYVVHDNGFMLACTPFDEVSVGFAMELGTSIMKVASCSAQDWPLIQAVAESKKPTIFSTGGLEQHEIDRVVSFAEHRSMDFALHHCVSIYPTPRFDMRLDTIRILKQRYPGLTIGWSTHENPYDLGGAILQMAYALGARMFERHVGEGEEINAYSSTGRQIDSWIRAWKIAWNIVDASDRTAKKPCLEKEVDGLTGLQRGLYFNDKDKSYLAIPYNNKPDNPPTALDNFAGCIHEIKAMINIAHVVLPENFEIEYSHHYGINRFREFGLTMITFVNLQYSKKTLILLPGQTNPAHRHKIKTETFFIIHGDLTVTNCSKNILTKGQQLTLQAGQWHTLSTENGVIFEEISTTGIVGDSEYRNPVFNNRKTKVTGWRKPNE